jgi:Uma2 family endonuclease
MATISARTESSVAEGDQHVTLHGVDWKGYLGMLRLRGEHPVPRMVYLDGELLIVSPSYVHEFLKKRLGAFVHEVVVGLDIPCIPAGSTTFRRRRRRGGVEGDETYYLASAERIRGKCEIDLRIDPPPDLAIEVVHSHDAREAVEVYRRLGVSEVWVCDQEAMQILVLQANGRYAAAESSAAFPFLKAAEIFAWVSRPAEAHLETGWIKELRLWILDTMGPRRAGPPA